MKRTHHTNPAITPASTALSAHQLSEVAGGHDGSVYHNLGHTTGKAIKKVAEWVETAWDYYFD